MNDKKQEQFDEKLNELSDKYGLKKKPESDEKPVNPAEGYILGIGLISHIFIGFFMGYWVDKFFETTPLFLLIFIFLGFIAGFVHIWKAMK